MNMLQLIFRMLEKSQSNEQQVNVWSALLPFYNHNSTQWWQQYQQTENNKRKKKKTEEEKPSESGFSFAIPSLCRMPLSFFTLLIPFHSLATILFATHHFWICNMLEGTSRMCGKWENGMNGKQISAKSHYVERKSIHHRQLART